MKKLVLIGAAVAILGTATAFIVPTFAGDRNNGAQATAAAQIEIPRLLERKPNLGSPEERAQVAGIFDKSNAALKQNPNDHDALLQLAEVYMNEARITGEHPYYYPAALTMLDRVLVQAPSNVDVLFRALYMKASVQLSLHHFDRALATGNEGLRVNPYNSGIYGVLVDAHVELGQYAKAVEMSDKMISIRPDLRSYSRVSYLRELHGEVNGSIEAMKMAVDAGYPGYEQTAWCRTTLGELYERYGDLDNAAMHYSITLQERPDFPFALAGMASVEAKKGNPQAALELLDKALAVIPEVGFTVQKADLLLQTGQRAEAMALVDEALKMMQEDTDKGHNMGLEYARVYLELKGDARKCLAYAQKEYAMRPANLDVNKVMAAAYYTLGELDKAAEHVAAARVTGTKDPETLCLAGLVLVKQGQAAEGKALLKQAFEHNPHLQGDLAAEALALI